MEEEQHQQQQQQQQQPQPQAAARDPLPLPMVSAGESEHDSSDQEMKLTNPHDSDEEKHCKYGDPNHGEIKPDDLFDANIDEENEAWVYKHRRGGTEETVQIQQPGHQSKLEQAKLLKPRNSDAILSCPCCFEIVSMDCQQHERYSNQYRAMFVMNIGVDWTQELVYCDKTKTLVDKPAAPTHHVPPEQENQQVYYSVHCSACRTQVAALDMADEVYHFFGCCASA